MVWWWQLRAVRRSEGTAPLFGMAYAPSRQQRGVPFSCGVLPFPNAGQWLVLFEAATGRFF